jgi:hypothetical protein
MNGILKSAFLSVVFVTAIRCSSSEFIAEKDYYVIPFRMVGTSIPVVKATLNDKDAWFIVDTGASATLLNMSLAQYFGISPYRDLRRGDIEINGLGGSMSFESAICKIKIGQLTIHHAALKSKSLNGLFAAINKKENMEIAGILGSDILLRCHINVNYDSQTLSFKLTSGLRSLLVQSALK